jgi:N-acyl-D-aspartate/D-glutamate deacylase
MFDLIIRRGAIADGTGAELQCADIGIVDGRIAEIGNVAGPAREEIDATGKLVTPGFIDMHTHFDAQATWDERMQPSSWHGVTTVLTGNCGVGFAPCRPGDRQTLITLMEGVEDIPEAVMAEGLRWSWETFPEFLNFLATQRYDIDVAVQIPHSPIRVYVMGQRGADREPATEDEIARMRAIVAEAVSAGAFGVSTSRFLFHRTRAGVSAPSIDSAEAELLGLARGLADAKAGVFQLIPSSVSNPDEEFALMQRLAVAAERPLSFSLVAQRDYPKNWQRYLDLLAGHNDLPPIRGQVFPRPIGILFGLDLSFHPFSLNPSYRALEGLPLAEKVEKMRDPQVRAKILAESKDDPNPFLMMVVDDNRDFYPLSDPAHYDPAPETEVTELARRNGVSRREMIYDLLLEEDGHAILYSPGGNFINRSLDSVSALLHHPKTVLGLGDGGAHYGMICDASFPTFVLTHWARDAKPEHRISVADAVRMLTAEPAAALCLEDRGRIEVGLRADINIIDHDRLTLRAPRTVRDLPGGGRRLRQRADGFEATIVNGVVTYRNGEATGALPGRLLRQPHRVEGARELIPA